CRAQRDVRRCQRAATRAFGAAAAHPGRSDRAHARGCLGNHAAAVSRLSSQHAAVLHADLRFLHSATGVRARRARWRCGLRGAPAHGLWDGQRGGRCAGFGADAWPSQRYRSRPCRVQSHSPAHRRTDRAARTQARCPARCESADRGGSGDVAASAGLPRHDGLDRSSQFSGRHAMTSDLPQPDYARNMRLIGHCDQGGRPDGVQIMVHRGHAYVGHMFSKGFSVIDVRDVKRPRTVNYLAAPPGTWNIHLQTHDDLLLVINAKDMFAAAEFADEKAYYKGQLGKTVGIAQRKGSARGWTAGLAVYDIATPQTPRRIGFMPVEGGGIHRIWYTGGRWAYVSVLLAGLTDHIFMMVDL